MHLMMDYIVALTNLYGLVHNEKVMEIYNKQNNENAGRADVMNIANHREDELAELFVHLHGEYFVNEAIMIFDEFEEQLAKKRGKPFYIPNQEELLRYKDDFYFERTKEYKALEKYVQRHFFNGNAYKAERLCEDIHHESQFDFSLDVIFQSFERDGVEFESEEQIQDVMELVMDLANNVRLWENNGYTPYELHSRSEQSMLNPLPEKDYRTPGASGTTRAGMQQDVKPVQNKKIGRNDPCPCGSGKKYKKCCLGKM